MEKHTQQGNRLAWNVLLSAFSIIASYLIFSHSSADTFDPRTFMKGHSLISSQAQIAKSGLSQRYQTLNNRSNIKSEPYFLLDFETDSVGWQASGSWQVGNMPLNNQSDLANNRVVGTNLNGNYQDSTDNILLSPPIKLPVLEPGFELQLSFDELYQLESYYELGTIEITNDNGKTWAQIISTRSGSTDNQWIHSSYPLNDFAGQTISLRFRLISDSLYSFLGWYIDNIAIKKLKKAEQQTTISAINSKHFPYIYTDIELRPNQETCSDWAKKDNFRITEAGIEQSILLVEPPQNAHNWSKVDVVFIYDNSGSIRKYQLAIENKIANLVRDLADSNIDLALGLTRYGNLNDIGDVSLENSGNLTTNPDYFLNSILPKVITNESFEPSFHAIQTTAQSYSFRPGSKRVVILISDEFAAQGETTAENAFSALKMANVDFFALIPQEYFGDYEPLTDNPAKQLINIEEDLKKVADTIKGSLGRFYRLGYKSNRTDIEGGSRDIEIDMSCGGTTMAVAGAYTPGAYPIISLSIETEKQHRQPQPKDRPIRIVALIEDTIAPYVNSANLVYRSGDKSYQTIPMTQYSPIEFIADIPLRAIKGPKIQYYITATDGTHISSLPTRAPSSYPFELAIAPHAAPNISLLPISSGSEITSPVIAAKVSVNTSRVESVILYHRLEGELTYRAETMLAANARSYIAKLPQNNYSDRNIQFFIEAKNNQGLTARLGHADAPKIYQTDYSN